MGPVKVRVPAKINLHLGVGPLRADGYHEVTTVYHAIALFDEITARPADTLALTMDGEGAGVLALDDSNLVIRAVKALAAATGREPHARLHLRKQIPLAAGLAGGSADAAATLVACDALWGTGFSREELAGVAAVLGSDVPFLVLGGTALGTGRGEQVSPVLAPGHAWHWVVAFAEGGLATPDVYRGAGPAPRGRAGPEIGRLDGRDPCGAPPARRDGARHVARQRSRTGCGIAAAIDPPDAGRRHSRRQPGRHGLRLRPDVRVPLPRLRQRRVGRGGAQRQRHLPRRSHGHRPGPRRAPHLTAKAFGRVGRPSRWLRLGRGLQPGLQASPCRVPGSMAASAARGTVTDQVTRLHCGQ